MFRVIMSLVVVMLMVSGAFANEVVDCFNANETVKQSDIRGKTDKLKVVLDLGKAAVEKFPNEASAHICLGLAYMNYEDYRKAETVVLNAERLAKKPEEFGGVYGLLTWIYAQLRDMEKVNYYSKKVQDIKKEYDRNNK